MHELITTEDDSIVIDEQREIEIVVIGIRRSCVLFGVKAPREIVINREYCDNQIVEAGKL